MITTNILPQCAICNRPVERMERIYHAADARQVIFRVYCHGAMEECKISYMQFSQMSDPDNWQPRIAFAQQAAPPNPAHG